MKKRVWIMVLLTVSALSVVGWADENYTTYGKANGRYWTEVLGTLPGESAQSAKAAYVHGYENGLKDYADECPSAAKILETLKGISMSDRIKALDSAFSNEENRGIPIRSALALACSKIKGEFSQDEYDSLLEVMRNRYSE